MILAASQHDSRYTRVILNVFIGIPHSGISMHLSLSTPFEFQGKSYTR